MQWANGGRRTPTLLRHSSNQNSSVSLSSTSSPPPTSLSPPPNASSSAPPPPRLPSLTVLHMEKTSTPSPPLVHLAIPLFFSLVSILHKKNEFFLIFSIVLDSIFEHFRNGFFVFVSDYSTVSKKIERISEDTTSFGTRSLRYVHGFGESFGGNLSLDERLSHFDRSDDDESEIPCGFFKPFPISNYG